MKKWIILLIVLFPFSIFLFNCDDVEITNPDSGGSNPSVNIYSPLDEAIFVERNNIRFSGSGQDHMGEDLPDSMLVWVSNYDGKIGIGKTFDNDTLSVNNHEITLKGTDREGRTSSENINIEITPGPFCTIIIDQTPDALSGACWSLIGPQGETGEGDRELRHMPFGEYTIIWDRVIGYSTPRSHIKIISNPFTVTFEGTYGVLEELEFVLIPKDTFSMGSPLDEFGRETDETLHLVTLTNDFHMSSTEITCHQYAEMAQWAYDNGYCTVTSSSLRDAMDGYSEELLDIDDWSCGISFDGSDFITNPGYENDPVKTVSWYGAAAYCDWLNLRNDFPCSYNHETWDCNNNAPYNAQGYRLPTEAEWEYSCRAGTTTPFNTGDCLDSGTEANYDGGWPYYGCSSGPNTGSTVPVGSYSANSFGLYDMHGNILEWCNDRYGVYNGDGTDPIGPTTGTDRVFRGGMFFGSASTCRSARRRGLDPTRQGNGLGFRVCRSSFAH